MTTVVYRDGVLASDTLVSDGNCYVADTNKIYRVRGHLVGGCGSLGAVLRFCEWFKAGADEGNRPRVDDDFDTITIAPNGRVTWYSHELIPTEFRAPFHAVGSGAQVALGALHMGASAKQAVQVAMRVDKHSGGSVRTLRLK